MISPRLLSICGKGCSLRRLSSKPYRFVPSKAVWKRFDVSGTETQETEDASTFHISPSSLPPKTELSLDVVKLLERLSLTNFETEKCLKVIEEAIRFADPLLTDTAFRGTVNSSQWEPGSVEAVNSLTEVLYPDQSCELFEDNIETDVDLTKRIVDEAPVKWEGYFVAPQGNVPIEPKGIQRKTTIDT